MPNYTLDHLVITVQNIEQTCSFYKAVLGIPSVQFGNGRTALQLATQKINLHPAASPIHPHAQHPTPGSADICLITDTPLAHLIEAFQNQGVAIVAGPVDRIGAASHLSSIYIRDPDGNLVELANRCPVDWA